MRGSLVHIARIHRTSGRTTRFEPLRINPTSHQCGNQVANRVAYAQLMVQGLVVRNEQTIEYGAVMLNRVPNRAAKLERGSKQASFPCIKQGTQF